MIYTCEWRDNCNVPHAFDFESDNDDDAILGLIERCRSRISISNPDQITDPIIVRPTLLTREDGASFALTYFKSEGSEYVSINEDTGE